MKESSKRRRSKAQIQEDRKLQAQKKEEIEAKLAEYQEHIPDQQQLKRQKTLVEELQREKEFLFQEKENYRQLCDSLYQNGIIKQTDDGVIVAVEDASEREQIRSKTKQKAAEAAVAQSDYQSAVGDLGADVDINDRDKMDEME